MTNGDDAEKLTPSSELLASYRYSMKRRRPPDDCDRKGDVVADDEAALSRILESICSLTDLPARCMPIEAADASSTYVDVLGSALLHGLTVKVTNGNEIEREWAACLSLLRLILGLPKSIRASIGPETDTTGGASAFPSSSHSKSRVPPHIVLRTVVDGSLDLCDYDEADDDQNDEISSSAAAYVTITTKAKVLVLLGAISVRLAACEIRSAIASPSSPNATSKIRWRRAASMAMECIWLYQRLILSSLGRGRGRLQSDEIVGAANLHCRYLAPAVFVMLAVLKDGVKTGIASNDKVMSEFIEAGLVSATTVLSQLVNTFASCASTDGVSKQLAADLILELVQSSILPLTDLRLDSILLHPLRQWENERTKPDDFHVDDSDDDDSWNDDFTSLLCGTRSTSDKTGGMRTRWDSVGIAFIAYHILVVRFQQNDARADDILSCVTSHQYLFSMLYPNVETFLALGQSDNEEVANDTRLEYIWTGMEMLRLVLNVVGPFSRMSEASESEKVIFGNIRRDVEGPLGPVGNVQLLLNTAVAMSNQGGSVVVGATRAISKSDILGLVRKLLSCYPSIQHIRSIKILLGRCPYPFLESVLLDLLRPALVAKANPTATRSPEALQNDGTDAIEDEALNVVANYIDGMEWHIALDAAGEKESGLVEVKDLMVMVEQYTCTASLIRLLCIRRQQLGYSPVSENTATWRLGEAVSVLTDLHTRLRAFLECTSKEHQEGETVGGGESGEEESLSSDDKQYFQFHLLADALGEAERTVAVASQTPCGTG